MHFKPETLASQASVSNIKDDPLAVSISIFLHRHGFHAKRIAALFDMNQGRVTEVIKERAKGAAVLLPVDRANLLAVLGDDL